MMTENECLSLQYKKNKTVTQGVTGQLNEAKLSALILYRLLTSPKIKEFYMGSNLDGIGDMDDVCIRLIHEECEKPLMILIQAKHKDEPATGIRDTDLYKPKSDFYLPKNFSSLLKVKEKFDNIKNDCMFLGEFNDVIPFIVLYTPVVSKHLSRDRITAPKSSEHLDIVKDLIGSRKEGGNVFQIDFKDDDIKKITKDDASESEKNVAKMFFENLYYFTDQGKEDELGRELEREIAHDQICKGTTLQVTPNAVFLIFYNKVHRWWLSQGNVFYLSKNCNYLNSTLNDFVHKGYLTMLSYICVNHLELYPIQFKKSMISADKLLQSNLIISNSALLTSIKLKQHLQENTGFSYLDYRYVSKMSDGEFNILLSEIEETKMTILVIIDTTQKLKSERLKKITNEFHKNIVVTEESQAIDLGSLDGINVEKDYIRGLVDIENDEHILEYKIIVQGKEMHLNNIIDAKSKNIINADILLTILNNESLELGRNLFNYNDKHLFQRRVSNKHETYYLDTFKDIKVKSNVIVITAESGMGKSTLLTDLSAKKKTADTKTWIVKINLQDYSEDFSRWQDAKTEIGLKETMLLICKAELNATKYDTLFDLQITNNRLEVINTGIRGSSLLLLECIVHCFNEGNMLYLFDGFDKMCPYYEKIVVEFIKNLLSANDSINLHDGPLVWITSRPYNYAKRVLRTEFNANFTLAPLSELQQKYFYTSYWQANISKIHLNINYTNKQHIIRQNISNFFNKMSQHHLLSVNLEIMYETARNYLQKEYDCEEIRNIKISKSTYRPSEEIKNEMHFSGIPLYMELYANHFAKYLLENVLTIDQKAILQNSEIWRCDTFTFFEDLHDTAFEKIFYENSKPFKPDIKARCRRAKNMSSLCHQKLAFYSLFNNIRDREYYSKLPYLKTLEVDIPKIIKNIENGKEKIGLIDRNHKGLPKFVHQSFAECYAVEFIVNLLKSYKESGIERIAVHFVINRLLDNNVGLMSVFDQKLRSDDVFLKMLSEKNNKNSIFKVLMKQTRKQNSLFKVLDNGFEEIAKILVHSVEDITDIHKIRRFVEFINPHFFIYAASLNYIDLIEFVLCKIKKIDDSIIKNIRKAITIELNKNALDIEKYQMETIVERLRNVGIMSPVQSLPEFDSYGGNN